MLYQPNIAIIHYAEIALKGKNRAFFERALFSNIATQARGLCLRVKRISGRMVISFDPEKKEGLQRALLHVFGIHHFFLGRETPAEMETIKRVASEILVGIRVSSFAVRATRSEKSYPFTSHDIEKETGEVIRKETGMKVSLDNPGVVLFIEVAGGNAYMSCERIEGCGGLPVGVSGKVVSLLSSGFDSPVAALLMMKRGCVPEFLHFHSYPHTSKDALESVEKLRDIISRYSPKPLVLYAVPFADMQRFIVEHVPSPLRVVMYRRWMLWIADRLAERIGAAAIVTGDSVGQVSSQTLENIKTISEIASLPILRPLAGFDKEEIIALSKKYGTHDTSKLQFDDCCSLFMEGSPATHTTIEEIKKYEDPIRSKLESHAERVLLEILNSSQEV